MVFLNKVSEFLGSEKLISYPEANSNIDQLIDNNT